MSLFGPVNWSPDAVERLRDCVTSRKTSGETARALTREFGTVFTRNACIGKAKRLGLAFDGIKGGDAQDKTPKPRKPAKWQWHRKAAEKIAPPVRAHRSSTSLPEPSPLGDVDHGCRWLHSDDPRERNFCGADRHGTSRYCEHHFERCYQVATRTGTKRIERQAVRLANHYS